LNLVLTIAGFDPSGKAGILRDVSIISALGASAQAVPTALTIQDSSQGYGFDAITPELFERMLSILIAQRKPDAVKIGMVPNIALAECIAHYIAPLRIPIVYDTVFSTTDGCTLVEKNMEFEIFRIVSAISTVITPNIPEASLLSGIAHKTDDFEQKVFAIFSKFGVNAMLLKGGHSQKNDVCDSLFTKGKEICIYTRPRLNHEIRGTGCALSSALATFLAMEKSLPQAFYDTEKTIDKLLR